MPKKHAEEKTKLIGRLKNKSLTLEEKLDIKDQLKTINNKIKDIQLKQKNYYLEN